MAFTVLTCWSSDLASVFSCSSSNWWLLASLCESSDSSCESCWHIELMGSAGVRSSSSASASSSAIDSNFDSWNACAERHERQKQCSMKASSLSLPSASRCA